MKKHLNYKTYIILILILFFLDSIISKFIKKDRSKNKTVNDAILSIDNSFDTLGTFNKDHEIIFDTVKKLSSNELTILHNDFGTRYYHFLTGKYIIISILSGIGVSKPHNLNSLYQKEFDSEQLERMKIIYKQKDLDFPFVL